MSHGKVTDTSIFSCPNTTDEQFSIPWADLEDLITGYNKENANVPQNPEATNLTIAEIAKKEYALRFVFSQEVAEAHRRGDIRLHDLGMIDRIYCSGQSPAYIAKFGLNMPDSLSIANPAKHATVFLEQIVKMSASLQGHFAGAIGWDAVNMFVAPYIVGMSDKEIKQLAQVLIYEFSQQAVARGGQATFSDINLYWEIPRRFRDTEAILPGGVTDGRTYADFATESKRFFLALMEVYYEGDAIGRPFFFPKPDVHISEAFFEEPDWEVAMDVLCKLTSKMGSPYFIFDRGDKVRLAECCRLSIELDKHDLEECVTPWLVRSAALQNVTINLPRLAFTSTNMDDFNNKLAHVVGLCVVAHMEKRAYIRNVLDMHNSPLELLNMNLDGEPYLRFDKMSYLIGMLGLNEAVKALNGGRDMSTDDGFAVGVDIMDTMSRLVLQERERTGLKLVIEQTPAESTAYGLAKLDTKMYPKESAPLIRGTADAPYYTNSTQLPIDNDISPIERIKKEGMLHPLIDAGAITHIWLGEHQPDSAGLANLIEKIFRHSENSQVAFSPEFTTCVACGTTNRGLVDSCAKCGSEDVEHITRVTGYFSKVKKWNAGKTSELKDRVRQNI